MTKLKLISFAGVVAGLSAFAVANAQPPAAEAEMVKEAIVEEVEAAMAEKEAMAEEAVMAEKEAMVEEAGMAEKEAMVEEAAMAEKEAMVEEAAMAEKEAMVEKAEPKRYGS